jgi:hypothetical protein
LVLRGASHGGNSPGGCFGPLKYCKKNGKYIDKTYPVCYNRTINNIPLDGGVRPARGGTHHNTRVQVELAFEEANLVNSHTGL